ncbi:hypothetical protein ASE38_00015 [Cellulomonas sp. Root930]|nr:hypothetical protein ASE38_00015 [Cellulomonas sp. Root930]
MLKRLIIAAVGVVGLVVIGLGIASATVWRADDVLVATTSGGSHTLVTDPGVLELGGDPVTVTVSVPDGGDVVLAVGRDTDVDGWVGTDAHGRVTGLSGWHTLAVDDVAAPEPTTAPTPTDAAAPPADAATQAPTEGEAEATVTVADPTGSDLWVAEETGTGEATLVWPAQEGRWSLLAVSTGESAPTLSLAWPRVVTTPWLWPCVAVGTLLVLLAGWLLLRDVRRRRAGLDEPEWTPVHTGATPAVVVGAADIDTIPVLTRRQLREATQARAARPRTGPVPAVPAPTNEPTVTPTSTSLTPAPVGTSRRALRPPTGAIPVAPTTPTPERTVPAPGPTPTPGPSVPTKQSARPPVPAPVLTASWSARPPAPAPTSATPPVPGPPAASAPSGPPAPSAPAEHSTVPHGRPSWAQRGNPPVPSTATPAAAPPAPPAGPGPVSPAGWSAVPPPPGARLRPGSPAGPDAEPVHTGRPTWVRPATPPEPGPDESATAGSRADAWRRAWGLPPTEGAPEGAQTPTDTNEEDR